jgi:hypothetical protein
MPQTITDDDDEVLADGESVRVPLFLVDTVRLDENDQPHFLHGRAMHQPGFRVTDAASSSNTMPDFDVALRNAQQAALDARQQMIRRAENAWRRQPTRDAAQPDYSTRPEELRRSAAPAPHENPGAAMAHHLSGPGPGEAEASQRRRDRAYEDYVTRQQEAWKTPTTNPRAAPKHERELENWKGA